ncbi:hypothetical protein V502_06562 [Pseudogymnoascus sp. VKM F-4520 (FW-2644)]|nr:hypothetical protein V502_06562 [Pseudogymnoascus sp. VKM F-4520 (FW-2644)]
MDSSRAEGSHQYHGETSSSIPAQVQAVRHSENEQLNRPNPNSSQAPTIQNSDTQSPIYLLAKDCLCRFEGLYVALHNSDLDGSQQLTFDLGSMQSTIEDAHTRFRAWGTNIAAFRNGTSRASLDFRLAEAPRIKYRTMQVLEDLKQYLSEEVDLIARGEKINETWGLDDTSDSSDYSDEDDKDQKGKGVSLKGQTSGSDVDELLKAITASNASLMKLSIVIRSSATRDDYLKAASHFSNWNPFPDIGHVREKYGSAKYSTDWLFERLRKAITRRRQFLKYRIEHNDRLVGIGADDENLRDGPTKTIASTKATTFVGENILQKVQEAGSDAGNSFGSATSYEHTVFQGDGSPTVLTVPPAPKFAFPTRFGFPKIPFKYGQPFQCPYCFTEQTVENRSAWKTHVFRDLKPYVCTFYECEMLMFRSRHEWFTHELQNHRREWASHRNCARNHLSSSPLKALIMLSEEPIDKFSSAACPLCNDWETDMVRKQAILESVFPLRNRLENKDDLHSKPRLFRRHLGRHMEQLALFALPPNHFDDLEDESTDGEREEVEDDSSDKEEDDLSQGLQSANETWAPHIPKLSPAQDSLELGESKLSTASPQDDDKEKAEAQAAAMEKYEAELKAKFEDEIKAAMADADAAKALAAPPKDELQQHDKAYMTKEDVKLDMARRELDELRRAQYEASKKAHEVEDKPKHEYMTNEDYELERTRKELQFKLNQQRIEDEKLIKKGFELKTLQKEREEVDWVGMVGGFSKFTVEYLQRNQAAVEDFKRKQAENALNEKREKEQRDKEYKERVEEDMRKSGLTDQQIAAVLKKEKVDEGTRPTYTRMARRYLSYETLNAFRIDYTVDQDPEYILIKRWVPEYEQDFLWEHTTELRNRRRGITNTTSTSTTMLQVEGGDNHDNGDHGDVQY